MTPRFYISIIVGGLIFGFGLAFSGAAVPEVVLSFLRLEDLGLVLVIGVSLMVTALVFYLAPRLLKKPVFCNEFRPQSKSPISIWNVAGAAVFGVGWGVSGLCPATSFTALGMGNWPVLIGILGMFIGAFVFGTLRTKGLPGLD